MSAVIRSEQARPTTFSFCDLEAQARSVLAEANARARAIIQQAEARAAAIAAERAKEGYAEGLEKGRAEGAEAAQREATKELRQAARAELAQLTASLSAAAEDFARARHRLLAQAESGLIELALRIAERVCKHSVGSASETAAANARHLLELAGSAGDVRLHLNPHDHATLGRCAPEFVKQLECSEHVVLVADDTVGRGGCVLRSRAGVIDANVDTQLDRVARALLGDLADSDDAGAEVTERPEDEA